MDWDRCSPGCYSIIRESKLDSQYYPNELDEVLTDSRPDRLTLMEGLGWFQGSVCPHYHSEALRRPTFQEMILDGELKDRLARDDDAGVLFEGD